MLENYEFKTIYQSELNTINQIIKQLQTQLTH